MRILVCMCILSGGLAAQDATKTTPPPAARQTQKPPAAMTIPKDAVESEPGVYRWTDKNGKVWAYRRTPFGVKRWAADSADTGRIAADKRSSAPDPTIAVEQGDSIRFEQSTPFGKHVWVRKKTDMNESEQKIWDTQQKKAAASRVAEKE